MARKASWYYAEREGDTVRIHCDCGDEHLGIVRGDQAQTLEWVCPKTGELKRDVNA